MMKAKLPDGKQQQNSHSYSQYSQLIEKSGFNSSLSHHSFPNTFTELASTLFNQQEKHVDPQLDSQNHQKENNQLFIDGPTNDISYDDDSPQKPNMAHHLGINYRIVLTHYASMKKEVLFVPFVRGTREEYLLLNLQNYLDFDIEQLIKHHSRQAPIKVGEIIAIKPSGRLNYDALYLCRLPYRIRRFDSWKKYGSLIVRKILIAMNYYQHKKIIFPHFRIYGLPEEYQIKGFLMAFMNARKKMHMRDMNHPLVELMLTTSNKIHYEIWKEWLKEIAKSATSSIKDVRQKDEYDTISA